MSEEKKVEQDERWAFEAHIRDKCESEEYAFLCLQRNNVGLYPTAWVQSEWEGWQARAASTSANVDRFDPYRLKVAEECCERLMSACTDAGCPDGVRMDDWIRDTVARAASTSVNVAQGAEAVALTEADVERQYKNGIHIGSGLPRETCPCGFCAKHRFGFNSDAQSQIAEVCEDADGYKHIEAVIEDLDELPKGMKLYAAPPAQTATTDDARDAARYRWLRDRTDTRYQKPFIAIMSAGGISMWNDTSADDAIDAALTADQFGELK